ncbi:MULTISPECIES: hypothetical protein [Mesorhizobium]|jgi:hypothetical protein|uniref:hypothetical protein n=1 Tax=Mesorhizobium TaxID=68287 RepID=UPI00112629AC|nr:MULTISPECIES: hypothetical protein [Mesorhizobium]MCA0032316.1 hypothetical protein [Mesorhizobium sp. B263B2A]TPN54974.1 hypothetical protein FJ978_05650 [Mesorhizobium sp. B1-1-7]TPN55547.1 hypothetical protein FJ976_08225 [Mesorhizobium sp. B1-1-9]
MTALFVGPDEAASAHRIPLFGNVIWPLRLPSLPSFAMPSVLKPDPENQAGTRGAAGGQLP